MGQSESIRRRRAEIQWRQECERSDAEQRELAAMRERIVNRSVVALELAVAETDATIAYCRARMGNV